MKKFGVPVLITLILLGLCSQNYAQGICPITTLKINRIQGKVLSNDKLQEPIRQTKVELTRLGETVSLNYSTLTNDSGYFEINNVKKGKYALGVWLTVNEKPYFNYRAAITVKKSNDSKSKDLILVNLGLDCFTSEVSISK